MPGVKREASASAAGASKRFKPAPASKGFSASRQNIASNDIKNAKSSAEAHAIQRQLAKDRKMAKPNAEPTQRAKKLWERLRRKSHVPAPERKELVAELFTIVTGRVKEFVFKHDSVRVVQCALKYATPAQSKEIARELRGSYKELAESRYAKFLVGKILITGDDEVKGWVVGEMQGWVKKGIGHPEAGWILDDMYRQICTPAQKALLLREWYGPEYAISGFTPAVKSDKQKLKGKKAVEEDPTTSSDLVLLLSKNPEKRKPTLEHLLQMITSLINKKLTGFTMLHDAMLQYSLAIGPPSTSTLASDFLEMIKPDEDNDDLVKNLAFTKSGARLVARILAYSTAKDRKVILRVYKDNIETVAFDPHGSGVLLAAMESVDDTVMLSKLIFPELLSTKLVDKTQQQDKLLDIVIHPEARVPLLYPFTGPSAKWLIKDGSEHSTILNEVFELRSETSKKDPEVRRSELAKALATTQDQVLLSCITARAADLATNPLGCLFISEVLLGAAPHAPAADLKNAMRAVAALAEGDPADEAHIAHQPSQGRMLRTLAAGGRYDPQTKTLVKVEPRLGFSDLLYEVIKGKAVGWATGSSSFVVENMLADVSSTTGEALKKELKKGKKGLEKAATDGNAGAKAVLEAL